MNKKTQAKLNRVLQYIHIQDRKHLNCIRLSKADTPCWIKVIELAAEFKLNGIPFITQARIVRGGKVVGIADLITPLDLTAYEIVNSESKERFEAKKYAPFKKVKVKINAK